MNPFTSASSYLKLFVSFSQLLILSATTQNLEASLSTINSSKPRISIHLTGSLDSRLEAEIRKTTGIIELEPMTSYSSPYFNRWLVAQVDKESRIEAVKTALKKYPAVLEVEPIGEVGASSIEIPSGMRSLTNDPLSNYQWGYANQGQSLRTDIDDIHSITVNGVANADIGALQSQPLAFKRVIKVAVIDSGVDLDHDDLKNQLYRNDVECQPDGNLPFGTTIADKDGNGFAGDCAGWNFANETKTTGDNRPYDDVGHGTHIAGIISAQTDNSLGVRGFNNQIKILPIKVLSRSSGNTSSTMAIGLTDRITRGILYAVTRGVDVINLSMGWPESVDTEFLREAVREAQRKGIIVVAAAGNNGHTNPVYPCAYPGVICVGSMGIDGKVSDFSNHGSRVDVLAPGEQILSTYPNKLDPSLFFMPGYEIMSGTSQSSAFVSGFIATLLGIQDEKNPAALLSSFLSLAQSRGQQAKLSHAALLRVTDATLISGFESPFLESKRSSQKIAFNFDGSQNFWLGSGHLTVNVGGQPASSNDQPSIQFVSKTQDNEKLSVLNEKLAITSTSSVGNLLQIDFSLSTPHLNFERSVRLKVEWPEKRIHGFLDITLSRTLSGDPLVKAFPLNESQKGEFQKNISLRSIQDLTQGADHPTYYQISPTATGLRATVWELDQSASSLSLIKTIEIPNATKLLQFSRMTQPQKTSPIYLVQSFAKISDKNQILFQWLNEHFEPLFEPTQSTWSFIPDSSVPPALEKISWVWKTTPTGLTVPVAIYRASGKVPPADQSTSLFDPKDTSERSRIYYLDPILSASGVSLKTRILDNKNFKQNMIKSFGASDLDEVDPAALLPQSRDDQNSGRAVVLWKVTSRGVITLVQNQISNNLKIIQKKIPTNWDLSLSDSDILQPVASEDRADLRASLASFSSSQNGTLLRRYVLQRNQDGWIDEVATEIFHTPSTRDPILDILASYQSHKNVVTISGSKFHLLNFSGNHAPAPRELLRYSFLPGTLFQETFFALLISDAAKPSSMFALYQDTTQISGNGISILNFASDGTPQSSVLNSVTVPEACTPLNPAKLGKQSYFVLNCRNLGKQGDQNGLLFVSINPQTTDHDGLN